MDTRQDQQYASYLWRPLSGPVVSFGPSFNALINYDHEGKLEDSSLGAQFDVAFKGPAKLSMFRYQTFERYLDVGFHKQSTGFTFYAAPRKWMDLFGSYGWGTEINFSPGGSLAPFLSNSASGSFGLTLRTPRFRTEQFYLYSHLGVLDRPGPDLPAGGGIFTNHIVRWKTNYQFTRALSLRGIIDYYAVLPNTDLVRQERFKQITADVLMTYLLNPFTALYVGYTDRYQNLMFDDGVPPQSTRAGGPTYLTGRQFFAKITYLLRF